LKEFPQTPGGNGRLTPLLYPFERNFPKVIWCKYRWWKNRRLNEVLPKLNQRHAWLTVIDRLGAPGDALITANVIRCLKLKYPNLRINCITPHDELIKFDPSIESLNSPETFYSFDSSYWELIVRKEDRENVIAHNLNKLGIKEFTYKSKFFLSSEEKEWAKNKIPRASKPTIAICTRSKETVKNWPKEHWESLIESLRHDYNLIQIGDDKELVLKHTRSFSGKHTMRESAALLSQANLFIGPDSLLMHIANGLSIKSIIIFGGSRPVDSLGYKDNTNVSSTPSCSPCWIHDGYENCVHNIQCMKDIKHETVLDLATKNLVGTCG